MAATNEAVLEAIRALAATLEKHMQDEEHEIRALRTEVLAGFPDSDPDGHRKAHQVWIAETEKKAAFWEKMRFELARWGLLGFIGWLAYQAWVGFLHGPAK